MKKVITIIMLLVVMFSCVACSEKQAAEPNTMVLPGIVGTEHLDKLKELDKLYDSGEFDYGFVVELRQFEGYWLVYVYGPAGEKTMSAFGVYDHMPSQEEIDILWSERVPEEQLINLMNGLGF